MKYGYRRNGNLIWRYDVVLVGSDQAIWKTITKQGAKMMIRHLYSAREKEAFRKRQPVTVVEHSEVINQG